MNWTAERASTQNAAENARETIITGGNSAKHATVPRGVRATNQCWLAGTAMSHPGSTRKRAAGSEPNGAAASGGGVQAQAILERGAQPYGVRPLGNMWARAAAVARGGEACTPAGVDRVTRKRARVSNVRDSGLGKLASLPDATVQQVRLRCGVAQIPYKAAPVTRACSSLYGVVVAVPCWCLVSYWSAWMLYRCAALRRCRKLGTSSCTAALTCGRTCSWWKGWGTTLSFGVHGRTRTCTLS